MRKVILLFIFVLTTAILNGCTELETEEGREEIGQLISDSIDTLHGNKSVIMNFLLDYENESYYDLDFDVYINKIHNWDSIQMMSWEGGNSYNQDYRFVIYTEENDKNMATYYEWDYINQKYSAYHYEDNEAVKYVFLKASQGYLDLSKMIFTIDSILNMIEENAITLNIVSNEEESLESYNLYEITFDLNYFIENDINVLEALYGFKGKNSTFFSDKQQKVILGFDKESKQLKYFSYDQCIVSESLNIKITIDSIGEVAETKMEDIENSDIFPNSTNVLEIYNIN